MKVYVLMESKYGSEMQFAGVYATRGAAGEAVIDTIAEMNGCTYNCEVREHEVIVGAEELKFLSELIHTGQPNNEEQ